MDLRSIDSPFGPSESDFPIRDRVCDHIRVIVHRRLCARPPWDSSIRRVSFSRMILYQSSAACTASPAIANFLDLRPSVDAALYHEESKGPFAQRLTRYGAFCV